MNQCFLMLKKEWLNFANSDRGIFLVYLVFIAGWSVLRASMNSGGPEVTPIWSIAFSVFIAANFSGTVFVSERMSGSLEILLTSGLSRSAILYGKMLFVIIMTLVIGMVWALAAFILQTFISPLRENLFQGDLLLIYASATFLNAASAYFSVWLPNPRFLYFINLLMIILISAVYLAIAALRLPQPLSIMAGLLILLGILFTLLAGRAFESERIIKPIVL